MLPPLVCELRGIPAALAELRESIDEGVRFSAYEAKRWIAEDAKRTHAFQNQTGLLEASIQEGEVNGEFSRGDLEFTVTAEASYASFVEAARCRGKDTEDVQSLGPYAYLHPAFDHQQERIERELERVLASSARHAGWEGSR